MKKRMIAMLLCVAMVLALLPAGVLADDAPTSGTCGDNLTWTLINGTLTIGGVGDMYDYYYQSTPSPWNSRRSSVVKVIIEKGVTSIGNCSFNSCRYLTSVTIPDSVTRIGEDAFGGCSRLVSVVIPDSVSIIENYAFSGCSNLTSIKISNSLGLSVIRN